MQVQTTTPAKPTASQMLAVQRTLKKIKKLERKAKEPDKRLSKHQRKQAQVLNVAAKVVQKNYRQAMIYSTQGGEVTKEEAAMFKANDIEALENIVYERNFAESITNLELTVRAAGIIAHVIEFESPECHKDLLYYAKKAGEALKTPTTAESPSQRRKDLADVYFLLDLLEIWQPLFSKKTLNDIALYNTGVQVAAYFLNLYQTTEPDIITATIGTINGGSIRQMAKKLSLKENELRSKILQAAKSIYRIGLCQTECVGIEPAYNIPDLRKPQWQYLANFDRLAEIAAKAVWNIARPFTQYTGIDILNLQAYEKAIAAQQRKVLLA